MSSTESARGPATVREARLASEIAGSVEGCPSAPDLNEYQEGALCDPRRRSVIDLHVARCPACAEALRFLAEEPAAGGRDEAAAPAEVVARSEAVIETARSASGRSGSAFSLVLRTAAGIAFVGALSLGGYVWLGGGRDEDLGEFRGAAPLELLDPSGVIDAPPSALRWVPHPLAASYRVTLLDARMAEVWTRETAGDAAVLVLDAEALEPLRAGGRFTWQVVALGRLGEDLAASPAAHFEVAAPGE
jgi:hypothetical protein